VCVRECGAKWREINARLRYADVRVIYTFATVEKKKFISEAIDRESRSASMVAEIFSFDSVRKNPADTRCYRSTHTRSLAFFRFSIKLQSASVGTKSWRLFGPRCLT